MTRPDAITAQSTPIHAVIAEHGAVPVLLAAFKALFARHPKAAKPIRADIRHLDDWLRRDLGLPPSEPRARFPHRSP